MPKKIRTREHLNKKTDQLETRFYSGNKKASEQEIRNYVKSNFNSINPDRLDKETLSYYNKVKAGKARAAQSVRIKGQFIPQEYIKENAIAELARQRGFSSINDFFNNDPIFAEQSKKALKDKRGLKLKFNSFDILDRINAFKGDIYINDTYTSKVKAIERVDTVDKMLVEQSGAIFIEYVVYVRQFKKMYITLPTPKKAKEESMDNIEEEYPEIEFVTSPEKERTAKEQAKKEREPKLKTWSYTVAIPVKSKTRKKRPAKRKSGTIQAKTKQEATEMLRAKYPGCIIVSLSLKK